MTDIHLQRSVSDYAVWKVIAEFGLFIRLGCICCCQGPFSSYVSLPLNFFSVYKILNAYYKAHGRRHADRRINLVIFSFTTVFFTLFLVLFCLMMIWTKPWGFITYNAAYTALACIR